MPEMHIVTISNPSNKNPIRILSIKTGSPHFHASPVKSNVSSQCNSFLINMLGRSFESLEVDFNTILLSGIEGILFFR